MKLKKLEVNNFRNIENIVFLPCCNMSVISGQNGQGKTNLLESIWLLSGAKSFRGSKDIELIKKDNDFAYIYAEIEKSNGDVKKLEISIFKDEEKTKAVRRAKINGVSYKRAYEIAGLFNCVVFSPEHLSLIKGSPEGRRKFIDVTLCQLYPGYIENLRLYQRLITQKNSLLKQCKKIGFNNNDYQLLDTFDTQLACYGAYIAEKRKKYINDILPCAKENYFNISGQKETFDCTYLKCCENVEDKNELLKEFIKARENDKKAGFCTFGVHREDIKILINGEDSRIFASQGQQRSAVLSLKIAEAEQIKKITDEEPVLLFDDVLSELDSTRQDFLLNKIENKQVFVTGCDSNLFAKTNGQVLLIQNGKLV